MSVRKEVFVWKKQHKVALMREILVVEPYIHKIGSKERGHAWALIAENLNGSEYGFKVSTRSVREKFGKLYEDWLKKENNEEKASGIEGTVEDEFELSMRDVHERMEEVKEEWYKESEKVAEEKQKAIDIRQIATERIGQTKRRHDMEDENEDDGEISGKHETPRKRKKADFAQLFSDSLKMKLEDRRSEKQQEQAFQQTLLQQQNAFFAQQQQQMMEFMKDTFEQQQKQQQQQLMTFMNVLKK